MKILAITNFYPPHKIGGYEMLCQDVCDRLEERGHTITILTSTYGVNQPVVEGKIHRLLSMEADLHFYKVSQSWLYPLARQRNVQAVRRLVAQTQPDLVFIWGMWGLSKEVAVEAERLLGSRVVYYLANPWPIEPSLHKAYWEQPANDPWRSFAKKLLGYPARLVLASEWSPVNLQFQYAPCCSQALKDQILAGKVSLQDAPIIYEGINLKAHIAVAQTRANRPPVGKLSFLFVGILAPHKGVHTTIEALARLSPHIRSQVQLVILGTGHPSYEQRLRDLVAKHHLEQEVRFHQPIPRPELPQFLGQHDVLLLPSVWEEPLALIMQEGLASGMVVVGSATGGTKEIIRDKENGLLFPPDDPQALAFAMQYLVENPPVRAELSEQGHQTAVEKFDIHRMVDDLETYLTNVAQINPHATVIHY